MNILLRITLILLFSLAFGKQVEGQEYKYINPLKQTTVYDTPEQDQDQIMIGYLLKNQPVKILSEITSQWYRISFGNGYGYVKKKDTTKTANPNINNTITQSVNHLNKVIVTKEDSEIYDNTSGKLVPMAVVKKGIRYPILGAYGNTYKVQVGGRIGYIFSSKTKEDKGIPVLMYHHLLKDEENQNFRTSTTINVNAFEQQMAYMKNHDYKTVTLHELHLYLKGLRNLPAKSVAITFDDGLKSNYLYAYPILKKHNFKAAEFVITSRIEESPEAFHPDRLQFLSTAEYNQMTDVFSLESHTHEMHQFLKGNPLMLISSDEQIYHDLRISKALTGSSYLAYPFGAFDKRTILAAKKAGYEMGFSTQPGTVNLGDNPFRLKRLAVTRGLSLNNFKLLLGEHSSLPFNDVPSNHWAYHAVRHLYDLQVVNGVSSDRFAGNQHLTRYQLAAMLVRSLGLPAATQIAPFTDINNTTNEMQKEISAAYEHGLVNGFTDNTFKPNQEVTRSQLALMISRAYSSVVDEQVPIQEQTPFEDINHLHDDTILAIKLMHTLELMKGYDTKFVPHGTATRYQVAKVMDLFLHEIH